MAQIAVITGDLIDSTRVAQAARFRRRLRDLLAMLEQNHQALTTTYRGDGFQVALGGAANPFEVAILLRTGLIARSPDNDNRWDARVAIAFGTGRLSATEQNSAAYIDSGRTLDAMGKERMQVHGHSETARLALNVSTGFADDIINNLTPTEAEALYHYFLERGSHQSIADKLGKQRPTVTLALQRARYSLLDRYATDMHKLVRLLNA